MLLGNPSALTSTTSSDLANFANKVFTGNSTNATFKNLGTGTKDVILDYGANKNISKIKLWLYYDGRIFRNVAIYGSTDNTNWDTLRSPANWTADATGLEVVLSPAVAYRYIKFYAEGNVTYNSNEYNEIQVFDDNGDDCVPTMTGATTSGVTISDGGNIGGYYVGWKAFDDDLTTQWNDGIDPGNSWVKVDFGAGNAKTVGLYAIRSRTDGYGTDSPKTWTLQGSSDDGAWTTLDTQTNAPAWYIGERRVYAVASPASYRYYKMDFTANQGSPNIAMMEAELVEVSGAPPAAHAGVLFAAFI